MILIPLLLVWCGMQFPSVCIGHSAEVPDPLCVVSVDVSGTNVCYWLVPTQQDATSSEAKCNLDDGRLAYIPNEDVLSRTTAFVKQQLGTESYSYVGYTQTAQGGVTIQGTEQTWVPWDTAYGQPNGHEECIAIYALTGKFYDTNCSDDLYALCSTQYKPEITTEVSTDTNNYWSTDSINDVTTDVTVDAVNVTNTTTCYCYCDASSSIVIYPVNINEELQAKLDTLKKETEVNEEMLSSTIRAKTSASDPRLSSAYVGYLGIALLAVIFGGILLFDLPNVVTTLKTYRDRYC